MRILWFLVLTGFLGVSLLTPAIAQDNSPNIGITYDNGGVTVQGYGSDAPRPWYQEPQHNDAAVVPQQNSPGQAPPPPGYSSEPPQYSNSAPQPDNTNDNPQVQSYSDYGPPPGQTPAETSDQQPPPFPQDAFDQPPAPGDGYEWTPGYWDWQNDDWGWVPGEWSLPPYEGALWTPGYWAWSGGLWGWYPGYWGLTVGYYGGIFYGGGYPRRGYCGGYWHHGHYWNNRNVNNIHGRGAMHSFNGRSAYARGATRSGHSSAFAGNRMARGSRGGSFARSPGRAYNMARTQGYNRGLAGARTFPSRGFTPGRGYSGGHFSGGSRSFTGGGGFHGGGGFGGGGFHGGGFHGAGGFGGGFHGGGRR